MSGDACNGFGPDAFCGFNRRPNVANALAVAPGTGKRRHSELPLELQCPEHHAFEWKSIIVKDYTCRKTIV